MATFVEVGVGYFDCMVSVLKAVTTINRRSNAPISNKIILRFFTEIPPFMLMYFNIM
jgi:hypothetical protein